MPLVHGLAVGVTLRILWHLCSVAAFLSTVYIGRSPSSCPSNRVVRCHAVLRKGSGADRPPCGPPCKIVWRGRVLVVNAGPDSAPF